MSSDLWLGHTWPRGTITTQLTLMVMSVVGRDPPCQDVMAGRTSHNSLNSDTSHTIWAALETVRAAASDTGKSDLDQAGKAGCLHRYVYVNVRFYSFVFQMLPVSIHFYLIYFPDFYVFLFFIFFIHFSLF